MPRRIVIIGGPRVGKTTLSELLKDEFQIPAHHTSAELETLFPAAHPESWSNQSAHASTWFNDSGDWICEGVQMARALRKWLLAHPNEPLDVDILTLKKPFETRLKGQESMAKGVDTVFREIEKELVKRGARIHRLSDPGEAVNIFQRDAEENQKARRSMAGYKTRLTKEEWEAFPEPKRKFLLDENVYIPDGDGFKLDAEGDVEGSLKTALDKERKSAADAKKAASDLVAKYGDIDPDAARAALQRIEEADLEANKKKGDIQAILDTANKKFDAERAQLKALIQEKEALLGKKESVIQSIVLDQALTTAIAKHKGVPEILLPVIKAKGEVKAVLEREGSDVYVPRVFDKDGNVVFGDTKGNPMDPDQYVGSMKDNPTYARAFDAAGTGGTGAFTQHQGVQGNGKVIRLNRDDVKQDAGLYAKAKAEAEKTGAEIQFIESTH